MIRETVNALLACVVTFVLCAVAYPAAVWGLGQLAFPNEAEGSLVHDRERKRDRLGADRAAVRVGQVLLVAALGRRLQGRRDRRVEPRDEEPRPAQEGRRACRGAEGDGAEPRAGRPGDGVGRRHGPAHQPGSRVLSSPARGRCAEDAGLASESVDRAFHRDIGLSHCARTARECVEIEPGTERREAFGGARARGGKEGRSRPPLPRRPATGSTRNSARSPIKSRNWPLGWTCFSVWMRVRQRPP